LKFSILKNEVTESYIGRLEKNTATRLPVSSSTNGRPLGIYLRLTGEDARAFEEYQSMLKQLSSRSSRA